jgi:hypothetical protein
LILQEIKDQDDHIEEIIVKTVTMWNPGNILGIIREPLTYNNNLKQPADLEPKISTALNPIQPGRPEFCASPILMNELQEALKNRLIL